MLGGVAMQFAATNLKLFIAARVLSMYSPAAQIEVILTEWTVGFGLTFCVNAAPLLLLELSYPTQARPSRRTLFSLYGSHSSHSVEKLLPSTTAIGMSVV
jgi:hypothetical protein